MKVLYHIGKLIESIGATAQNIGCTMAENNESRITPDGVVDALKALYKLNPDQKIIVDLPDNKGGIIPLKKAMLYTDGHGNIVIDAE